MIIQSFSICRGRSSNHFRLVTDDHPIIFDLSRTIIQSFSTCHGRPSTHLRRVTGDHRLIFDLSRTIIQSSSTCHGRSSHHLQLVTDDHRLIFDLSRTIIRSAMTLSITDHLSTTIISTARPPQQHDVYHTPTTLAPRPYPHLDNRNSTTISTHRPL